MEIFARKYSEILSRASSVRIKLSDLACEVAGQISDLADVFLKHREWMVFDWKGQVCDLVISFRHFDERRYHLPKVAKLRVRLNRFHFRPQRSGNGLPFLLPSKPRAKSSSRDSAT